MFGVVCLICVMFLTYRIEFQTDSYDVKFVNRITGLGWGIQLSPHFEIWEFAYTVHGGMAEKRFFPLRRYFP